MSSPALRELVERVNGAGGRVWLVGGALRDLLLRDPSAWRDGAGLAVLVESLPEGVEIDLATDLTPERMLELFPEARGTGLRFGTVLVLLGGAAFEVTTLRREGAYSDGRRPDEVAFTTSLEDDLARRDFTVNALALELPRGELVDPWDGRADLERRRLRAVGDAGERLAEDGLRAYRACRLAATLEFDLDDELFNALAATGETAAGVAWERIGAELHKAMAAPRPGVCFELLRRSGLLERCLPELAACYDVPQAKGHEYDVYEHSLAACDLAPVEKPAVRWAALLHDVGKPLSAEGDGKGWTFHGHERVSAELAERALRRLRLPRELREAVVHLVRRHMFLYRPEWSDAAVRRFVRRVGVGSLADLFDLALADRAAKSREGAFGLPADIAALMERVEELELAGAALEIQDLAVDGADLLKLARRPAGPWVGAVLGRLLDEVIDNPELNEREELLQRAAELLDDEERRD